MRFVAVCVVLSLVMSACGSAASSDSGLAPSLPGSPTSVIATAGDASIRVAFTAPSVIGASAITLYTVTCIATGISRAATGTVSPITVTGLANGTRYSCSVTASNASSTSVASAAAAATPAAVGTSTAFTLTSPVVTNSGALPATYTCDGTGSSPALAWANAPTGTNAFAVLMTTLPGDGTTKWNWVLYGIPASKSSLAKDSYGVGSAAVGSDGPTLGYQAPCSQGPGAKVYTFTVYALSSTPSFPVAADQVTGQQVTDAIRSLTLATATLNVNYARATYGTATQCNYIRTSLGTSTTGIASANCDSVYAYISSEGLATHSMMNGIVATNLQVPIGQTFFGDNAWRIPLTPSIAGSTTSVNDGPIGVAINGVPIFNPCKQGGCQNGDTKALGELDVCNGHAGRADDYHYHAAPTCLMAGRAANFWDTHPIGWALDGFAIFGYNNADGTVATRDNVCGGNTSAIQNAPSGYSYHVTDASPYVLSCLRGTPSPDLANQGRKYAPMRQPPVTPFANTAMTLTTDPADGYEVLQFTTARAFTATETGTDSYANPAGTYRVRYKAVSGQALTALLAQSPNVGKSACWNFLFTSGSGTTSQPAVSYCR